MTEAENLDYRNVFYRRGSTVPEWFDPSATNVPLFFQLSQYDDIPVAWRDFPKRSPNPRKRSMKNISPKRFDRARYKSKLAKQARKTNRKR